MKKRFLQFRMMTKAVMIALLLGVIGIMKGYASYDFIADNLYYVINADGSSVTIIGHKNGTSASGSLTIPASVSYGGNSYLVTEIYSFAFAGCSNFTGQLSLGNSLTTIGDHAFYNCSGFNGNLVIPNSVTNIGNAAFCNCSGFTGSITIPNSLTTINNSVFYNCNNLSGELIIPNSVISIEESAFQYSGFSSVSISNSTISIGNNAFNGCSELSSVTIGSSVTSIGDGAFNNCNNLSTTNFNGTVEQWCSITFGVNSNPIGYSHNFFIDGAEITELIIPEPVTLINDYSFRGCHSIVSISIPNTVISIGSMAFYNCSNLINVNIGNSVATIKYAAFSNCTSLSSITIPNSTILIEDEVFMSCSNLKNVVLGNSITAIGNYAFAFCGKIESLIIPNDVTNLGNNLFKACYGLTSVTVLPINVPSLGVNAFLYLNRIPTIYVPYESLNAYKTATNWSNYESRIFPMAYTAISGYNEGNNNWQFIASPLAENTVPTTIDDMLPAAGTYDLYRFDQSEEAEWRNYKAHTNDFTLANGQGYLYANAEDVNLIFKGEFNEEETKEVGLAYDANVTFSGWNLVGNPFPVSAYANRSYYVMNEDGTAIEPVSVSSETAIAPCIGVMVKAETAGESVIFSKTAPEAAVNQGVLQIAVANANQRGASTGSATALDKAIVSFNAGDHLEKFVFNKDNATLCIPQGGKDLAIAYAEKEGEMPLNFKAIKNGEYTITVNPEAVEMDYLHLIDNMTGNDIDLLASPSYSFNAKTTDYESRFKLVFSTNDVDGPSTGSGTFAFHSNGNIIINGEGTVQVIDMTGRIIVSVDEYTRCIPTAGMTSGVYVLRLIEGDDVKTQKIVVR